MGTRFLHFAVLTHGSGRNDEVGPPRPARLRPGSSPGSGRNDEGGGAVFARRRARYQVLVLRLRL